MLRDVLAPEERRRADDYFQEKDRRTSTVARGLLRLQLAQYTGLPPAAIRFDSMGNGKPVLAASTGAGGAPPVYFNVSHSGKGVLLGFTRIADIGVDIEDADRDIDDLLDIAENFFAPGEARVLRELPPAELRRGFFNCWTRKEAFIKVYGEGLSRDLNSFEVELRPDQPPRLMIVDGSREAADRFSLLAVDPEPDHVAAVCLPAAAPRIQAFAWDGRSE